MTLDPHPIKPLPSITCAIEKLGPDEASALLAHNDRNRNPRPRNIERFARDMLAGRWVLNGETMVVAESGRLLNGQNRLLAVQRSGVTIEVIVVRGVPDEAFATIDQGAKRTIGDVLAITGEENARNLAATAGAVWRWSVCPDGLRSVLTPTEAETEDVLLRYPGIRESVKFAASNKIAGLSPARMATLHFLFSQIDGDDAADFFESLASGANLAEGNPVLRLREFLLSNNNNKRRLHVHEVLAIVIKSWNYYRSGRTVAPKGLRWRSQGPMAEPFPEPV